MWQKELVRDSKHDSMSCNQSSGKYNLRLLTRDKINRRGRTCGQQVGGGEGVREIFEHVSLHSSAGKYPIPTSHLHFPGIHKLCLIATSTE